MVPMHVYQIKISFNNDFNDLEGVFDCDKKIFIFDNFY